MDPGTAKEEHRATNSPDNNVAIDGDHGLEPESAQKSSSISTGGLDGGCGKLDSVKNAETDTAGDVDDEAAVELPDSIQKKRIIRVPSVSRKGQRAIGACIFSIAVGIAVGIYFGFRLTHSGGISVEGLPVDLCGTTLYPDICNSTLFGTDTTTPRSYVSKSMSVSATSTNITLGSFNQCLLASGPSLFPGSRQYSTLQMCVEMSQATLFAETTFLATLNSVDTDQPGVAVVNDLEQRASAALTYHFTCVNELEAQGLWRDGGGAICGVDLERSTALLSNALSLVGTFKNANETVAVPSRRRLLNFSRRGKATSVPKASRRMLSPMDVDESRPPPWPLNPIDRRILQSSSSNNNNITPNAVVALDGSGDFTSVQAAVDHAPSNSSQRYVIYIKAGTYDERVRVPEDKLRLTLVGDGAGTTIVTGNASSGAQNVSALFTATVTVVGDFFMAKNLTIRNTAGPNGQEAVALRVTSHQSAFAWLSIEGYQNTLYAHANQQFYSNCTILGTVDVIWGSAAAFFQSCSLLARPPNSGQTVTYTASDISSSAVQKYTGLVFQFCSVNNASQLPVLPLVFLGRPLQPYAQTVFFQSGLGALVDPAGWTTSNGSDLPTTRGSSPSAPRAILAEYANFGVGSGLDRRVPWSEQLTLRRVRSYGVDPFLKGNLWLPAMNVSYYGGPS